MRCDVIIHTAALPHLEVGEKRIHTTRDDPGNFWSRHSTLGEDTLITQIEGPTMHLQLFILLVEVLVESNH